MSDPLPAHHSRRKKIARRIFIGSSLTGAAGWWLTQKAYEARVAAQSSADK